MIHVSGFESIMLKFKESQQPGLSNKWIKWIDGGFTTFHFKSKKQPISVSLHSNDHTKSIYMYAFDPIKEIAAASKNQTSVFLEKLRTRSRLQKQQTDGSTFMFTNRPLTRWF